MLSSSINGVVFLLWIVALCILMVVVTFLASLVLIFFFPPVLDRAYANDKFTTLRLDD